MFKVSAGIPATFPATTADANKARFSNPFCWALSARVILPFIYRSISISNEVKRGEEHWLLRQCFGRTREHWHIFEEICYRSFLGPCLQRTCAVPYRGRMPLESWIVVSCEIWKGFIARNILLHIWRSSSWYQKGLTSWLILLFWIKILKRRCDDDDASY